MAALSDLGATIVGVLTEEGIDHYAVAVKGPEGNEFASTDGGQSQPDVSTQQPGEDAGPAPCREESRPSGLNYYSRRRRRQDPLNQGVCAFSGTSPALWASAKIRRFQARLARRLAGRRRMVHGRRGACRRTDYGCLGRELCIDDCRW